MNMFKIKSLIIKKDFTRCFVKSFLIWKNYMEKLNGKIKKKNQKSINSKTSY